MKNIFSFIIIASLFFSAQVSAQTTTNESAFASQHGIFIKLENDYPQLNVTDKSNVPEYEIKRKAAGEKNFKKIATIETPATYDMFIANLKEAVNVNPEPLLMKEIPAEILWRKFSAGGYDSIVAYRNAIFLQLALGIKYFDATAEKNITYEYEITKKANTGFTFVTNAIAYPVPPQKYVSVLHKEKETALGISLDYSCNGNSPALIRVYREENYSGNFLPVRAKRIKTIDKEKTSFAIYDTVVKPNTVYRYYVLPLDYYGNYGINSDTITTIAASAQYAGNIKRMDAVSYFNEGTAIRWKLSEPQNFNYVAIYRTENFDSTLVKIGMASAADTQFVDVNAEPMKMYFYAVQPITRNEAVLPISAKITGMFTPKEQPLSPYITESKATENKITLSIKNNDPQTRGYRVYRKINTDSVYTLISGLIKANETITIFEDTANSIAGKYYTYMAKAESKAYVLSAASNYVTVHSEKKADLISIGIPKVEIKNNNIVVQWQNKSIMQINTFSLYRKDDNGNISVLRENITPQVFVYTDTTAKKDIHYQYGISYTDINGNASDIAYAKSVLIENTARGPANIYAASHENTLIISWADENVNALSYKIYTVQEDKPILLSEVNADINSYTLRNVKPGEAYTIYITSVNKEKEESLPGKTVMAYIK